MLSNTKPKKQMTTTIDIIINEGGIQDFILLEVSGRQTSLANNDAGWMCVHNLNKIGNGVTVVFRKLAGEGEERTPWLESAPYLHRRRKLEA